MINYLTRTKPFLAFLLVFSLIAPFFSGLSAHALNTNNTQEYDLVDTAYELQSLSNNNMRNGNVLTIDVIKNTEKVQEVRFTEGTKSNVLLYNRVTGDLYVDGNLVVEEEIINNTTEVQPTALLDPSNISYHSISLGQKLSAFTVGALAALILSKISLLAAGGANILASGFISAATSDVNFASSWYVYYKTWCRVDNSYTFYMQYWQGYKTSSYTTTAPNAYTSQKIYGSN